MATITKIYGALSARAYAGQRWPELNFHDQAARLLAKLLGIYAPVINDPLWERSCLLRSKWFDGCCRNFFDMYPQGMCIDLGAGLSTRFHRLSETDDWPRFSWVDIDLPDITEIKAKAFPKIDNYQLLAANIAQDDWLAATGWHPRTPLIITIEAVLSNMTPSDIYAVFSIIARHCTTESQIDIVLNYPIQTRRWQNFFKYPSQSFTLNNIINNITRLGLVLKRCEHIPVQAVDSFKSPTARDNTFFHFSLTASANKILFNE